MREGKLYYDGNIGRYDVRFPDGGEYGGLHCGEVLEILFKRGWCPARLEYDHVDGGRWYLSGLEESPEEISFYGMPVRISG